MYTPAKNIPFTPKKYKEMQAKVVELETRREETMKRLVTAREMGDLSENGAYKYAKFELRDIGRQLRRLKKLLLNGFPAPKNSGIGGVVDFGSSVTLEKRDTNTQTTYTIVSKHESDLFNGKLAYSSPLGKALMRKREGEVVQITAPKGVITYSILEVR